MAVTPDNRTLIIAESFAGQLTAFDIAADGGLSSRWVFAGGVAPDGICLDTEGAIWVSTGFSVARVAEGGEVLQRVELPEGRAPFALNARLDQHGEPRRSAPQNGDRPTTTSSTSIGWPTGLAPERS